MTTRDTPWLAGTPCWVDNMSTNGDAARAFYSGLFGWTAEPGPPEAGGYSVATVEGHKVAGIMPAAELPHPPVWTTYLATDNAAETCEKITAAGGALLQPAMDVMDLGVMAVAQDPTGAIFGIWESKAHTGFHLANEPGTVIWNEVLTRDVDAAKAFYASVFGYTLGSFGEMTDYAIIEVDGSGVGGIGEIREGTPAAVPPHWKAYFNVANTDESVEKAVALGGTVLMAAQDMPYGRHAEILDPNGAVVALLQNPEAAAE
jgi:hypothetical protein